MSFTAEEKKDLFDKLDNHSVSLGVIETKLTAGENRFTDLQKTRDGFIRHKQHHKTLNWVLGVSGTVITIAGIVWGVVKG